MRPFANRRTIDVAAAVVVCALALRGASNLYADGGWLVPAAVALVAGAALALVPSLRRLPLSTTILIGLVGTVAGLVVYGAAAAEDSSIRDVVAGGYSQLLTVVLPAETTAGNLAPVLTLTAIGAFGSTLAAWRSGSALSPLLGPVTIVVGLGLLSGRREPYTAPGIIVVVAAALVFVLVRTLGTERQAVGDTPIPFVPPSRPLAALGAVHLVLALVAGAAVGWGLLTLSPDRFEPRDHIDAKVTEDRFVSPLADFKALITDTDDRVVAMVTPNADVDEIRLRLAVLDRYDGTTWSSGATYRGASQALPGPPDDVPTPQATTSFTIAIEDVEWRWLPTAAGYPVRLDGVDGLTVDPQTGLVRVDQPDGKRYTVETATVPPANLETMTSAEPRPAGSGLTVEFEPGTQLPPALDQLVALVRAAGPDPLAQLRMLRTELAKHSYDDAAPPGHSLGVLENFQLGKVGGTAEHFAATFALVANLLEPRIPTRVAIGLLRPGALAGGKEERLTTRNYHVWPEVNLRATGWTPVEVTEDKPELKADTRTQAPATTVVSQTEAAQPETASTLDAAPTTGGGDDGAPLPLPSGPWRVPAVLLAIVLVVCAGILIAKARRTRRRRTVGSPRERVVGAWLDLTDRLAERGLSQHLAQTPREFSDSTAQRFGPRAGEVVANMGRHVDNAVFGDHEVDDADVVGVWRAADEVRKEADRQLPVGRRIQAQLDPRRLVSTRR